MTKCKDCNNFESKYKNGCNNFCIMKQKEIKNIYRIPKWCPLNERRKGYVKSKGKITR